MDKFDESIIENIASVCHEANRAYCSTIGDDSQPTWQKAPDWQKNSARTGVKFHLEGNKRVEDSHESWMDMKVKEGWIHGEKKDADKKTHPCIVPFNELPVEQQMKDHLFRGIVHSFKGVIES